MFVCYLLLSSMDGVAERGCSSRTCAVCYNPRTCLAAFSGASQTTEGQPFYYTSYLFSNSFSKTSQACNYFMLGKLLAGFWDFSCICGSQGRIFKLMCQFVGEKINVTLIPSAEVIPRHGGDEVCRCVVWSENEKVRFDKLWPNCHLLAFSMAQCWNVSLHGKLI